jgi:hypothetical protein
VNTNPVSISQIQHRRQWYLSTRLSMGTRGDEQWDTVATLPATADSTRPVTPSEHRADGIRRNQKS